MDKHQAEIIANNLLAREAKPAPQARPRDMQVRAMLALLGCVFGSLIAYAIGAKIAKGCLSGGFAGLAVSVLVKLAIGPRAPD